MFSVFIEISEDEKSKLGNSKDNLSMTNATSDPDLGMFPNLISRIAKQILTELSSVKISFSFNYIYWAHYIIFAVLNTIKLILSHSDRK